MPGGSFLGEAAAALIRGLVKPFRYWTAERRRQRRAKKMAQIALDRRDLKRALERLRRHTSK